MMCAGLISLVSQDTYLFTHGGENLLIAPSGCHRDDLTQAARQAQIHDFIQSLPEGIHTWIGDGVCGLKGGERQRWRSPRPPC